MSLAQPSFVARRTFVELRPQLAPAVRFEGLWSAGNVLALRAPSIAVVGSRAPSDAGGRLAFETGRRLAAAGVCVISGLALGVDGAAHAGALAAGRPTVGILGGGHRCFHPRRNRRLAERMIAAGGAVISPYAADEPARPWQFLQRNGVVAALADAVVVVEAAERSGALNTASWAADLAIPVFAFPGDVDRPKVAGCLALLRDGASLARDADDILADLGLSPAAKADSESDGTIGASRTPLEKTLLSVLAAGESTLEQLLDTSLQPAATVLAALTALEVEGALERRPGPRFALLTREKRGRGVQNL